MLSCTACRCSLGRIEAEHLRTIANVEVVEWVSCNQAGKDTRFT